MQIIDKIKCVILLIVLNLKNNSTINLSAIRNINFFNINELCHFRRSKIFFNLQQNCREEKIQRNFTTKQNLQKTNKKTNKEINCKFFSHY